MAVPLTPVVTTGAISDTKVLIVWTPCSYAVSYVVKRGATTVATETAVVSYTDIGLTASTTYSYTVTAVNAEGETVSVASSVTTNATTAFITRINNTLISFIESVTKLANGTWYNYIDANERDLAKVELTNANAACWFDFEKEDAVNGEKAYDNTAYHNNMRLIIRSVVSTGLETGDPRENYKVCIANMTEDFKRIFANNFNLSVQGKAFWNEIFNIEYINSAVDWKQHKDSFTPGVLVSEWKVSYVQLRSNPNQIAN